MRRRVLFSVPSAGTSLSTGAEHMCYNLWVGILDPKADAKTGERFQIEFFGLPKRKGRRRVAQEVV